MRSKRMLHKFRLRRAMEPIDRLPALPDARDGVALVLPSSIVVRISSV